MLEFYYTICDPHSFVFNIKQSSGMITFMMERMITICKMLRSTNFQIILREISGMYYLE